MKVKESKFGAPVGFNYLAKFQGCFPFEGDGKPRLGRDGKPMGAAIEWQFEITVDPDHGGQYVGQTVGRITQADPTTRNSCGKLLAGLVGQEELKAGDADYEPGNYVGLTYQLVIDRAKEDPTKTYVTAIKRVQQDRGNGVPASALPPPRPAPPARMPPGVAVGGPVHVEVLGTSTNRPLPPPAPPRPPAAAPKPEPACWFCVSGGDPLQMTVTEFKRQVETLAIRPEDAQWMPPDQTGGWQPVVGAWFMTDGPSPF